MESVKIFIGRCSPCTEPIHIGGVVFSVIAGTPGGKIGWIGKQLMRYNGKYKTYINFVVRGHRVGAVVYGNYVGS